MNKVRNKGGGVIKHHKVYARKGDETLEFSSVPEAASLMGFYKDKIYKCCNGRIGSVGGYEWSYTPFEEPKEKEEWKDCLGYENHYQVNKKGDIRKGLLNTFDKELLLKDLCARLPYGVKVTEVTQGDFTLIGLTTERVFTTCEVENCHNDFPIENIKPYLFPMSSMTEEEQRKEYQYITERWIYDASYSISDSIDYLNKNHFDYRGLIEKGLAIDATGKDIY